MSIDHYPAMHAVLPSFGCVFILVRAVGGTDRRIPASRPYLHQLILDGALTAESMVAGCDDPNCREHPSQPLRSHSELVPFPALLSKVVRLHRVRRDDEARHWAQCFHNFDPAGVQIESGHVQFIEALILEKSQPQTAEKIYLELSRRPEHALAPIAKNNLAVLLCRAHRAIEALPWLEEASQREPPLMAALLNLRVLLEHVLDAPKCGPLPNFADHDQLKQRRAQVTEAIERISRVPHPRRDLIDQLIRPNPLPAEEYASVLTPEDMANVFGQAAPDDGRKAQAFHCLEAAKRALGDKNWQEADIQAQQAGIHDPEDAVVSQLREQISEHVRSGKEVQQRQRFAQRCDELLRRVYKLKAAGTLNEALQEAVRLATHVAATPRSANDSRMAEQVRQLEDELRHALAEQRFDEAMEAHHSNPDTGLRLLREAAELHPSVGSRAKLEIALWLRPKLLQQIESALEVHQFEQARQAVHELRNLSPTEELRQETERCNDRINERQADWQLQQAEAALRAGNADQARQAALQAQHCDANAAARVQRVLQQLAETEAEAVLRPVLTALNARELEEAEKILREAPPHITDTIVAAQYRDVLAALLKAKKDLAARDSIAKAELTAQLRVDEFVAQGSSRIQIEQLAKLVEAERLLQEQKFQEAAQLLLPSLRENPLTPRLLAAAARRELERLEPWPAQRQELATLVVEAFAALSEGRDDEAMAKLDRVSMAVPECVIVQETMAHLFNPAIKQLDQIKQDLDAGQVVKADEALCSFKTEGLPQSLVNRAQALREELNKKRTPERKPNEPAPRRRSWWRRKKGEQ